MKNVPFDLLVAIDDRMVRLEGAARTFDHLLELNGKPETEFEECVVHLANEMSRHARELRGLFDRVPATQGDTTAD